MTPRGGEAVQDPAVMARSEVHHVLLGPEAAQARYSQGSVRAHALPHLKPLTF